MKNRIIELSTAIISNPRIIGYLRRWPKFSLTSYQMVSALEQQNIRPKTIIDIGANIGQFTIAAHNILAPDRIHAFEPVPDCFRQLKKNVSPYPSITIYPIGLGASEETLSISVNTFSQSSSFLPLGRQHKISFPDARPFKKIAVKVHTLDNVFNEIDLVPPVLLKIDTQGFEKEIIKGGGDTLRRVDYAIVETSFTPLYEGEVLFDEIEQAMMDLDFRFVRPMGFLEDPRTREILQMDGLFRNRGI